MNKTVIETLIELCNFQIKAFEKQAEIVSLKLKLCKYIRMANAASYKESLTNIINSHNKEIIKLKNAFYQLQKLKKFELSEENIEDMVPGGNMDNEQVYTQYMKGFRDGLYLMYEQMKSKLKS